MRRWMGIPVAAVMLSACVTINVYFPAAEAKEAAREFVEKVIGDEAAQPEAEPAPKPGPGGQSARLRAPARLDLLALVGIGSAHAQGQPDIDIKTPAIQAIQARMAARFEGQLRPLFDAGALGFANDGTVAVRDAAKIPLAQRVAANQAVAEQNRDAKAVYREIAVANDHPEWEQQIRAVFARQWIDSARPGWWVQDAGGGWRQK
ncbi:DUF1318 domain-containing protein [Vulcaniibacterium tengchongense]|uniref:Uncharacterized protein DUF1318 n=1 Tax=Vulcaniibacterium tengchongense TaxID=1273429 RepID=A0A3N4V2B5_9GAMM|nr:DUF1318 domain-containing protein [Vulcaniibacterium tengchongense]RPE77092.1 uncharacterized protein DUF1318 [Vulcaniibacterium tengchongense]